MINGSPNVVGSVSYDPSHHATEEAYRRESCARTATDSWEGQWKLLLLLVLCVLRRQSMRVISPSDPPRLKSCRWVWIMSLLCPARCWMLGGYYMRSTIL